MEIERAIEVLKEYNNCKAVLTEELEDATDIAIQALEMQIPKKPNTDDCCPDCGTYLKDDNGVEGLYCPNCGQKIDWGKAGGNNESDNIHRQAASKQNDYTAQAGAKNQRVKSESTCWMKRTSKLHCVL